MVEVDERVRPLKTFDDKSKLKTALGANQDTYVVMEDLNIEKVEEDLLWLKNEK